LLSKIPNVIRSRLQWPGAGETERGSGERLSRVGQLEGTD
jgi:hypothetical protein